jgi:GT2 family glycosyltransferase
MSDFYRVVILSYNHPEITLRCVKSVLALGLLPEHLILVHNGSDKNFVQYLSKKLPGIQHLILEKNIGFTGGANAGLRLGFSQSEWVYFLTNDTEALNLPIQIPREPALISPLVHRRKVSVIASRLGFFDPRWGELRHLQNAADFRKLPLHGYLYAPGAGFLMPKAIFAETGGFDEALHTYWEDVDLSVRVQKAGFQVKHDPKLSLIHFVGKTCHRKAFYTTYLFHRNRKIVSFRYLEKKFQGLLLLILAKDFLFNTIRLSMSRRWKDIWLLLTAYLSSPGPSLISPPALPEARPAARHESHGEIHGEVQGKLGNYLQTREWIQPVLADRAKSSPLPSPGPTESASTLLGGRHEPSEYETLHQESKRAHDEHSEPIPP